jgi:nucleotide-binding universal stress UspA family protein
MFPTRILLASDGKEEAVLAAETSVELANGTGSELHVVYVVSTVPELPYPHALAKKRSEAILELKRLNGLRLLDDLTRWIEALGGNVAASHYREGRPDKEVVLHGGELDAGLIVTGGQRRSWFKRILGVGFSEIVSWRADRPVLVVGPRGVRGSPVPK